MLRQIGGSHIKTNYLRIRKLILGSRKRVGVQCLLDLHGCPFELLDNVEFITTALQDAVLEGCTTLIESSVHRFAPQGVTAIGLLAESHLSIHTWPELGYAAVDIFTCGKDAKPMKSCLHLAQVFEPKNYHITEVSRYALTVHQQGKF